MEENLGQDFSPDNDLWDGDPPKTAEEAINRIARAIKEITGEKVG